MSFETLAEDR